MPTRKILSKNKGLYQRWLGMRFLSSKIPNPHPGDRGLGFFILDEKIPGDEDLGFWRPKNPQLKSQFLYLFFSWDCGFYPLDFWG